MTNVVTFRSRRTANDGGRRLDGLARYLRSFMPPTPEQILKSTQPAGQLRGWSKSTTERFGAGVTIELLKQEIERVRTDK